MNLLCGLLLIFIGVLAITVTHDITLFVLAIMLGFPCLFRKKNRHYNERRGYK